MKKHAAHSHHITPIKTLGATFVALSVFMILTIFVAEHPFANTYINNAIALTIAVIKATLVVMIFMGVKYTTKLARLWALAGFVWLTLMGITYGDYITRSWDPERGWNKGDNDAPVLKSETRKYYEDGKEVAKPAQQEHGEGAEH